MFFPIAYLFSNAQVEPIENLQPKDEVKPEEHMKELELLP
jgi:hypothetical protein